MWGEIGLKQQQYHSLQHATGSLSKRSVNLGAQLVQSSFCRAEISLQAFTWEWENRGWEGGCGGCASRFKTQQRHACYTPTLCCSSCCPPCQGEYKRRSLDRRLDSSREAPQQPFPFFTVLHFHSRAIRGWEWKCVKSSRTSRSLSEKVWIMGALMVIFSLQPKQRRKTTGRHDGKGTREFNLIMVFEKSFTS